MPQYSRDLDSWAVDVTDTVTAYSYAETNFSNGRLIPTATDLDPAVKTIKEFEMDMYGETDFSDELGDNIPEFSISMGEVEYKVTVARGAITYKEEEVEALLRMRRSRTPMSEDFLINGPYRAAIDSMNRYAQRYAAYGRNSTPGLLNFSGVPTQVTGLTPHQPTFTAQDLVNMVRQQYYNIIRNNNLEDDRTNQPTLILAPSKLEEKMTTPIISNVNPQLTPEQAILGSLKSITRIHYTPYCNSDVLERYGAQPAGTNQDWFLIYNPNPRFVARRMSVVKPYPSSYQKGSYWIAYRQAFGQTMWRNPMFSRKFTVVGS